jgi:dTDP-6-deoxy-L-talose 4-dehydrogenase (NAD+)
MNRRILLTGATGFVGREVLKAIQMEESVDIVLVARCGWQDRIQNQKGIVLSFETKDLFSETAEWWEGVCKNVDTIVHVAWYAETGKYLLSKKNTKCLQGTLSIAEGAIAAGVRRFVGIGTCFEYDLNNYILSIDTPLKPVTPYAASKAATYLALSQLLAQQNIEFAWCRIFYLYGNDDNEKRLVSYIRSKLKNNQVAELTSGNYIRDFMNVSEAGKMVADVAFDSIQGAVNICSGVPVTIRQIAEKIADEYGRRDLLKFGARPDNLCDPVCVVGVKEKSAL